MKKSLLMATRKTVLTALQANKIDVDIEIRTRGIYRTHIKRKQRNRQIRLHNRLHDHHYYQIITNSKRDCYAALGLLHSLFPPVPGLFKDFVATPKTHSYQSLHSVVLVEMRRVLFQIRTKEMHERASKGAITLLTKGSETDKDRQEHIGSWLQYLHDTQSDIENPQEFLAALKEELIPEDILVFTPDGKLLSLPRGATALDFAFAIHSEIGLSYNSAIVNGIEVEKNVELETGDCILIRSDATAQPEQDWLGHAITSKAKKHIKSYLEQEAIAN